MGAQSSNIGHVRCGSHSSSAVRQVLQQWMVALDLRNQGLPADAILLVRQLRAPLRALARDRANEALTSAVQASVRPSMAEFVPAGAAAVWFADEAELLACLARDVVAGLAGQRWWWPLALGSTADTAAALHRWVANAREVPRALASAPSDWQMPWLQAIGTRGRERVLDALAEQFPVANATRHAILDLDRTWISAEPSRATGFDPAATATRPPPIQAEPARPGDSVRALWSLAMALAVDPLRALDGRWADASQSAQCDGDRQAGFGRRPPIDPRTVRAGRTDGSPANSDRNSASRSRADRALDDADRGIGIDRFDRFQPNHLSGAHAVEAAERGARDRSHHRPVDDRPPVPTPNRPELVTDVAGWPVRGAVRNDPKLTMPAPVDCGRAIERGAIVPTQFGGLLFLLHAAIALGLYGDFSQPRHAGLSVSPWLLLHHAGRRNFGRRFLSDPLAKWLADKADSTGPRKPYRRGNWCAGGQALQAFGPASRPWQALVASDGVLLRHPLGFTSGWVAVDGSGASPTSSEGALAYLCDELALAPATRSAIETRRCPAPLRLPRDTLDAQVSLLTARVALALGMPARHACALTVLLHGRLRAHAGHVHIEMALVDLPLAVRLSGLDRDLGWLPAAGCDIRFHFAT